MRAVITSLLACLLFTPLASAELVTIRGAHLCCGGCQAAAEESLSEVKGITNLACDLNTKVIAFQAADEKTATIAIKALAVGGFHGQATLGKKPLKFPASGAKKGAKANAFVLTGVHLCCTACVTASQQALIKVKGVTVLDIDRNEKTIKLTGDSISISEAVAAMNKAGFHCQLPTKKPAAAE